MARNLPPVTMQFDTFETWIARTNELIQVLRTETLTANSSSGITGSPQAPLNATLFGSFTANTIVIPGTFTANSTSVSFGSNVQLRIGDTVGSAGQVLTSNGSALIWATPAASSGTVNLINTGVGLIGGPITTSGSVQVRANTGIIANTSGLFTDDNYIRNIISTTNVSVSQLQGRTWEAPGTIGSSSPNSGVFTTVTAINNYRFGPTGNIIISSSGIASPGLIEGTTPPTTSTGGLRLKARVDNTRAYLQVTNHAGTVEWSHVEITPTNWSLTSDMTIRSGIQVGYRIIPQIIANQSLTVDTSQWSGQHLYKTVGNPITMTIPDNASVPCPIGTTITIINDSASGNITLAQGGSTILQLGGTLNVGNRIITAGGFATLIKVQANKWIINGPGVL